MLIVDNILVSDEVLETKFVCDLARCKGGCCEEGDAGAPLEKEELDLLVAYYDKIRPYLTPAAVREIEKRGKYVYDREFGWVTPTLPSDREICVYGTRTENGMISCAFERAYNEGLIPWKKPVSCHLFPVIVNKGKRGAHDTVNYEPREKLCNPACALGEKLGVPVYEFLKEPLVRRFGASFYEALDQAAKFQSPQPGETVKQKL